MAGWVAWVGDCTVDLGEPHEGCELHAWLAACDDFIRRIDQDWAQVADWYRTTRASPTSNAGLTEL